MLDQLKREKQFLSVMLKGILENQLSALSNQILTEDLQTYKMNK